LLGVGDFSTGDVGIFHPALTHTTGSYSLGSILYPASGVLWEFTMPSVNASYLKDAVFAQLHGGCFDYARRN
jgi:hypothetical protein